MSFINREETKEALEYIRKESLDIYNRLHSIEEDIKFVHLVHEAYSEHDIPFLPNLRCGAWYTDPEIAYDSPAYFKSTDGHFNNWSFNLRRANLQLLKLVAEHEGIALVDSTRSGKRMPDALSKTIPIWCAVINRAMKIRYPELPDSWDVKLYTPPHVVSTQEHRAIELRLDEWSISLANSSYELPKLPNPLRPMWITPSASSFPSLPSPGSGRFCPVICISASKQIGDAIERRGGGFSYVQGSGDDHELWGMGLTPAIFWRHRKELLHTPRSHLSGLVESLVMNPSPTESNKSPPTAISHLRGRILICALADLQSQPSGGIDQEDNMSYLLVTADSKAQDIEAQPAQPSDGGGVLHLHVASGKRGQYQFLKDILPRAMGFVGRELKQGRKVCIACETGKDISVGIALAASQKYFDDDGTPIFEGSNGNARWIPMSTCN
ncbi:tRNA A64-2'-O-ribosylphosphate transferase, variant 2 [Pleurotus ostreatus]|nr:tRNA A64-2'-O-ribosylphosphate transferase, variant 2 [Pleurotus ostreatus]